MGRLEGARLSGIDYVRDPSVFSEEPAVVGFLQGEHQRTGSVTQRRLCDHVRTTDRQPVT